MSDTASQTAQPSFRRLLLAEAARDDRQATEALLCTYGINLGFFESQLLGPLRSTGAVVTTLSDAHAFPVDTRAMTSAGISYVPAVAAITGAFHPKVNILAGPRRAIISVGSGNLSMDGWHNNDELCAVFTADIDQGCPAVVADLIDWLDTLPSAAPAISPAGIDALGRVANTLRTLSEGTQPIETGHTLVHNNTHPIIDQLPTERAHTLSLYAPFHGAGGHALQALIERFQPSTIAIAVQTQETSDPASLRNRTVIDPPALRRVAEKAGVSLSFLATAPHPYRHGKLIEATLPNGHTWTLTGSANLSKAALLNAVINGGNCEVGLITQPVTTSLFPPTDGAPLDGERLQTVTLLDSTGDVTTREPVTLLSAEIHDGQIVVNLSGPAPFAVTVEISHYRSQPDEHTVLGVIPVGAVTHAFDGDYPGGSRVQLSWTTADDTRTSSASARPLIDRSTARRRVSSGSGNTHTPTEPTQFFEDPALSAAWLTAVQTMATQQATKTFTPRTPPPAPVSAGLAPAQGWLTIDDPDTWQGYLDDASTRLGETMVVFALGGLPRMAALTAATPTAAPDWVDRPDKQDASAEEGATIEEIEETAHTETTDTSPRDWARLTRQRTAAERKRVRNWLRSVVDAMPQVAAIDRLAMYRIMLLGTGGRFWEAETGPDGWFDLLADATVRLDGHDIPSALYGPIGSAAAAGTYLLDQCVTPGSDTRDAHTYRHVVEAVDHLLLGIDDVALDRTLDNVPNPSGLGIDAQVVRAHADLITDPNPVKNLIVDARRLIDDLDDIAPLRPGVWRLVGEFTDPGRAAAAVLGLAPDEPVVAAWAIGRNERWALLIRHGSTLTWVDRHGGHNRYRDFPLGQMVTPSSLAANPQMQVDRRVRVNNITVPTDPAAEALLRCRVRIEEDGPGVAT